MTDHTATLKRYYAVFGALLVLTLVTVAASYVHLPPKIDYLHTPIAFAIAGIKALLVLLYFMHLRESPWLIWLIAFGALLWLAILVVLVFADVLTRPLLVP